MSGLAGVSPFDYVVLAVILLSLSLGVWRGVVAEILSLIAWVAAFLGARTLAEPAGDWLLAVDVAAGVRQIVGFVVVFIATLIVFIFLRWLVSSLVRAVGLGSLDRLLGAVFGLARGVLIVWVGVMLAGLTALPAEPWWRTAMLSPPLETAVLAARPWLPPDLAKRIRYR